MNNENILEFLCKISNFQWNKQGKDTKFDFFMFFIANSIILLNFAEKWIETNRIIQKKGDKNYGKEKRS